MMTMIIIILSATEENNDDEVDLGAQEDQEMRDEDKGRGSKAKTEKFLEEERQK